MSESKIVKVKFKDAERSMTHKFLVYDDFEASTDSDLVKGCIVEARKSFQSEPESIKIVIELDVK